MAASEAGRIAGAAQTPRSSAAQTNLSVSMRVDVYLLSEASTYRVEQTTSTLTPAHGAFAPHVVTTNFAHVAQVR